MLGNVVHQLKLEPAVERRITSRLVAYWERVRKGRAMPTVNDIAPQDLADLWGSCFLIQVHDIAAQSYTYGYLGNGLREAYSGMIAGENPNGLLTLSASTCTASYGRVIASRKPVIEEGEFINPRGDTVKFRQCLLPLGHGDTVNAIFGGMRFKIVPGTKQ